MIEKIVTSKTRVKLLILFLTHIDDRYYLRELERMLDESLSPLRRQLLKLVKMGILVTEEEANLKYYRLNKNFTGIEELRKLVLETEVIIGEAKQFQRLASPVSLPAVPGNDKARNDKRFKYDAMVLTAIAFFVLATAVYVGYVSSRNVKQVASLVTERSLFEVKPRTSSVRGLTSNRSKSGEMISRRWKLLPGNIPVLSSGETGGKRSEEL